MAGHIAYKILPELELIIEYYSGKITVQDIIDHKKKEINNPAYNGDYNFIADIRESILDVSQKDFKDYLDFIEMNNRVAGNRRTSILTDTPNQVAITSMFKMSTNELPINYAIFSTLEAAINWVNLSADYYDVIRDVLAKKIFN